LYLFLKARQNGSTIPTFPTPPAQSFPSTHDLYRQLVFTSQPNTSPTPPPTLTAVAYNNNNNNEGIKLETTVESPVEEQNPTEHSTNNNEIWNAAVAAINLRQQNERPQSAFNANELPQRTESSNAHHPLLSPSPLHNGIIAPTPERTTLSEDETA
jgi:hypothetical protein